MTDFRLRRGSLGDAAAVTALSAELFREDAGTRDPFIDVEWPARHGTAHFTAALADEAVLVLVAERDHRPAGYLLGRLHGADPLRPVVVAELESMVVTARERSTGIGSALIAEFLAWARSSGAPLATVTAYAANTGAVELYERCGFTPQRTTLERPVEDPGPGGAHAERGPSNDGRTSEPRRVGAVRWNEQREEAEPDRMGGVTRFLAAVPALPVSDERRAVAFFESVLGFTELRGPDGAGLGILRRDAVELHVWVADGSAPGAERHLAGSASCRLQVTGVVELHEHCRPLDVVHPRAPLTDQPWGAREFAVLDPDGNLVALFERV